MAKKYEQIQNPSKVISDVSVELGTVPPQAVELEEAVLGALMIEKDSIMQVQEFLQPESFYKEVHQVIYRSILELSAKLEPIDLYTVYQILQRKKLLDEIGGKQFLVQLTQKVGSAAHIEFHAKIIAQKYVQRELIRASTEIQKRSFDSDTDITDLIEFAEGEIFKVAGGNVKRDVQDSKTIIARTLARIEEASKRPEGISGVPTSFDELDKITSGWQPADLVIIAARPSMGKTAFVLSLTRNVAVEHKKAVAFFSLEMSSEQLMTRLLVAESELDSTIIKNGRLTTEQWAHLERSLQPLAEAPMFIDDTPALSIFEFRSKVRRLKSIHNIELIIIDYLQLMTGNVETRGNREQEVASISRALKAIAKELGVPIIALSQLNRSVESRGGDKRPQLSDLRESGAIEQDADIVSFIHRPEYYGFTETEDHQPTAGLAEIIIAKHRNGATGSIKLRFRKEQARFMNWDGGGIDALYNESDISFSGTVTTMESSRNNTYTPAGSAPLGGDFDEDSPF